MILIQGCNLLDNKNKPVDKLIATVYDKKLHLSDMAGMFPLNANHDDSLQLIGSFATRWTKEQVFLTEAEKHIPQDLEIEELLKKYSESLISLNFQKLLTEQNLDSLVSEEELRDFYEKNKDQYQLETSIIRCYFVKIPDDIKELRNVREWWDGINDDANRKKLARMSEKYDGIFHLEDSVWHNLEDIESLFPANRISTRNWTTGESLSFSDKQYTYFFQVLELVSKQDAAPMSYVAPKARRIILNQRKNKLVEDFKTKLYETEIRKNNVTFQYK
ncbi:MAG: hypothetical protein KA109_05485 [Saprospiraceae bacterium]|jgi:hypothetical protein|nr:hypothetical protein [Saprospiraceae bacterium]MBK6476953.1 hypothetical protein [Saprospiraceae bacterium]MBK6814749.1 hypothetical protein [Saprospiraceae bacterium]MBK8280932.1 hypothetical protein [Saprospiraceae bacterium]MBK8512108.1 hypothetical protein [Saprospiraceae bacterium]